MGSPNTTSVFRGVARLVSGCLLLLMALFLVGMAREGHKRVWKIVLGIEAQAGNAAAESSIQELYKAFSEAIDKDANDVYNRVKKVTEGVEGAQVFNWSTYGHAIFFHWTFNAEPKEHRPLMELVKRCRLPREKERECMDIIGKEWKKRREDCLSAVRKCLGVSELNDVVAIATIIHDTHILADYIENTRTKPLAPMKSLKDDLLQKGLKVLARGNAEYESQSDGVVDVGGTLHNKLAAQQLLDNLSQMVPLLLQHQCGEQLAAKGIQIAPPAPTGVAQGNPSEN